MMEPGEAASTAVAVLARRTVGVARDHPKITGTWAVGLVLVALATGFTVTQEAAARYERGMQHADLSEPIGKAASKLARLQQQQYAASGFFSCDERCQRYKAAGEEARSELEALRRQEAAGMSEVKKGVGVLSEYAVAETRDTFWNAFAGGKSFAKRQSMWDLIFTGLNATRRRDENMAGVVLKWLIQLLFNFTLGLVGALVVFWWKLWSIVQTYQPDPATGLLFACCAALAATSMVATYLFAMYFCAASGVAAVAAAASAQARIEQEKRKDPRYRAQQELREEQFRQQQQQQQRYPAGARYRY